MKRVIVSVTNDLLTDQRVSRVCSCLLEEGHEVLLVGRKLKNSLPMDARPYSIKRMGLLFEKGPLFYAEYNLRLFFLLLFSKVDMLYSNDLDTLLPNYVVSRLRSKELIYDSHEYYTGVPELEGRPFVKGVWKMIERFCLPKVKKTITVNTSIANLYKQDYGIEMAVVRNVPKTLELKELKTREQLGLPLEKKLIILQGSGINVDRGGEEAVQAMKYMEDAILLILGSGDVIETLKRMAQEEGIKEKVMFKGRLPFGEMMQYTRNADIGLTLDKDTNINYRYSLPNKLFDYIQAGIPVLASRLPEVENIINQYKVGDFISTHDPKDIAAKMQEMLSNPDKIAEWKQNAIHAAQELCWEKEKHQLIKVIR